MVYNQSMSTTQLARDFSLPDQFGHPHSLHDYLGKWVVLYFYPKDDTPGCTTEACNFRDSLQSLQKLGVVILGVSKDSVASHTKFAIKYNLNFPILSDPDEQVIKAYNSHTPLGTARKTYLINSKGEITKVYPAVNPTVHAQEILADLQTLQ